MTTITADYVKRSVMSQDLPGYSSAEVYEVKAEAERQYLRPLLERAAGMVNRGEAFVANGRLFKVGDYFAPIYVAPAGLRVETDSNRRITSISRSIFRDRVRGERMYTDYLAEFGGGWRLGVACLPDALTQPEGFTVGSIVYKFTVRGSAGGKIVAVELTATSEDFRSRRYDKLVERWDLEDGQVKVTVLEDASDPLAGIDKSKKVRSAQEWAKIPKGTRLRYYREGGEPSDGQYTGQPGSPIQLDNGVRLGGLYPSELL